jgi:hypothetical protein
MTNANSRDEIDHLDSYRRIIKEGTKRIESEDGPFAKLLSFIKAVSKTKMATPSVRRIVSTSGYPLDLEDSKKNNKEIVKLQSQVQNRYGLLLDNCMYELSYRATKERANNLIEVINAIDFYKENKGN